METTLQVQKSYQVLLTPTDRLTTQSQPSALIGQRQMSYSASRPSPPDRNLLNVDVRSCNISNQLSNSPDQHTFQPGSTQSAKGGDMITLRSTGKDHLAILNSGYGSADGQFSTIYKNDLSMSRSNTLKSASGWANFGKKVSKMTHISQISNHEKLRSNSVQANQLLPSNNLNTLFAVERKHTLQKLLQEKRRFKQKQQLKQQFNQQLTLTSQRRQSVMINSQLYNSKKSYEDNNILVKSSITLKNLRESSSNLNAYTNYPMGNNQQLVSDINQEKENKQSQPQAQQVQTPLQKTKTLEVSQIQKIQHQRRQSIMVPIKTKQFPMRSLKTTKFEKDIDISLATSDNYSDIDGDIEEIANNNSDRKSNIKAHSRRKQSSMTKKIAKKLKKLNQLYSNRAADSGILSENGDYCTQRSMRRSQNSYGSFRGRRESMRLAHKNSKNEKSLQNQNTQTISNKLIRRSFTMMEKAVHGGSEIEYEGFSQYHIQVIDHQEGISGNFYKKPSIDRCIVKKNVKARNKFDAIQKQMKKTGIKRYEDLLMFGLDQESLLDNKELNDDIFKQACRVHIRNQIRSKQGDGFIQEYSAAKVVLKIQQAKLINPESNFSKFWSSVILLLMLYTAIIMPFKVSFLDDNTRSWIAIDTLVDLLFIADIIVTLQTPYFNRNNKLVISRTKIFKNYLYGWLLIDIASSFPIELVETIMFDDTYWGTNIDNNNHQLIKLARIPKIYKLFRVTRLFKISKIIQKLQVLQDIKDFLNLTVGAHRFLKFILITMVLCHIIACSWFIIAKIDMLGPETWVSRTDMIDKDIYSLYLASIYWTFVVLLTVGYGDITAFTNAELMFATFWSIVGAVFFTLAIGNLSSVLSNIDTKDSTKSDKLETINEFCKEAQLDKSLRNKLMNAIEYTSDKNFFSWVDKQKVFSELPSNLKCQIALEMHNGIIQTIKFFDDKDSTFIGLIVPLLQPLMAVAEEIIYRENNHSNHIFFISKGRVSFVIEEPFHIGYKDMLVGGYFGEIEVINKVPRKFTTCAVVATDFLTLSKQIFETYIIEEYPDIMLEMKEIAYEREKRIMLAYNQLMTALQSRNLLAQAKSISSAAKMDLLSPNERSDEFTNQNEKSKTNFNSETNRNFNSTDMLKNPYEDTFTNYYNCYNTSSNVIGGNIASQNEQVFEIIHEEDEYEGASSSKKKRYRYQSPFFMVSKFDETQGFRSTLRNKLNSTGTPLNSHFVGQNLERPSGTERSMKKNNPLLRINTSNMKKALTIEDQMNKREISPSKFYIQKALGGNMPIMMGGLEDPGSASNRWRNNKQSNEKLTGLSNKLRDQSQLSDNYRSSASKLKVTDQTSSLKKNKIQLSGSNTSKIAKKQDTRKKPFKEFSLDSPIVRGIKDQPYKLKLKRTQTLNEDDVEIKRDLTLKKQHQTQGKDSNGTIGFKRPLKHMNTLNEKLIKFSKKSKIGGAIDSHQQSSDNISQRMTHIKRQLSFKSIGIQKKQYRLDKSPSTYKDCTQSFVTESSAAEIAPRTSRILIQDQVNQIQLEQNNALLQQKIEQLEKQVQFQSEQNSKLAEQLANVSDNMNQLLGIVRKQQYVDEQNDVSNQIKEENMIKHCKTCHCDNKRQNDAIENIKANINSPIVEAFQPQQYQQQQQNSLIGPTSFHRHQTATIQGLRMAGIQSHFPRMGTINNPVSIPLLDETSGTHVNDSVNQNSQQQEGAPQHVISNIVQPAGGNIVINNYYNYNTYNQCSISQIGANNQ